MPDGRRSPSTPISRSTAPVAPDPQKMTQVSSSPLIGVTNDLAGVLAQSGGLSAGAARLGVSVRVAGEHLVADEVLEKAECACHSPCSRRT